jgi:hypothetical protein
LDKGQIYQYVYKFGESYGLQYAECQKLSHVRRRHQVATDEIVAFGFDGRATFCEPYAETIATTSTGVVTQSQRSPSPRIPGMTAERCRSY